MSGCRVVREEVQEPGVRRAGARPAVARRVEANPCSGRAAFKDAKHSLWQSTDAPTTPATYRAFSPNLAHVLVPQLVGPSSTVGGAGTLNHAPSSPPPCQVAGLCDLIIRTASVATMDGPGGARMARRQRLRPGGRLVRRHPRRPIIWVGPDPDWRGKAKTTSTPSGRLVTPGYVDPHTHSCTARPRRGLKQKLAGNPT